MAQKWYQKAGVQSAIVGAIITGIFLIIIALMTNNTRNLEKDNKDKDIQIQQLETQLVPFKTIALEKYTGNENERLTKLAQEFDKLEESTQQTVLIPSPVEEKQLPDGSFEYSFNLEPEGKNVIPILSVDAKSENGVKINSIVVQGDTIPGMAEGRNNKDQTIMETLYRTVLPSSFKVVIKTAGKTMLQIGVVPFKQN